MNKSRLKMLMAAGALLAALFSVPLLLNYSGSGWEPAWKPLNMFSATDRSDHRAGYMVNIVDDTGNVVAKASRGVSRGDEIIQADGRRYQVTRVGGDYARAKYLGTDNEFLAYCDFFSNLAVPAAVTGKKGSSVVGIYHTHSDESYVPSDGTEAIPFKGGIYQVGASLAKKLSNEKVKVAYDKTPHDPHDNNAYYRSRRTATRLMKDNPVALLDVHRDGIPDASYYRKNIANEDVARLRLVVGRQNPNMKANLDFAKRMMAYANKTHPNIVKEIFMAKGSYNQDLMPTALLIEAGTHVNSKPEAENGVALFADAIPTVLGITGGPGVTGGPGALTSPRTGGGAWSALAWILGLTVVTSAAFLLISSGGWKQARQRLSSYVSREFTGFLGPVKKMQLGSRLFSRRRKAGETDTEYDPDANETDSENRKKIR